MADRRVVRANDDIFHGSIHNELISNISRDIDILLDDKDEIEEKEYESSSFHRKLSDLQIKRIKNELSCVLRDFVTSEIVNLHDSSCSKNKDEMSDPNKPMFKYMSERITFLEEEIKFKNLWIKSILDTTTKPIKHDNSNLSTETEILNSRT